MMQNKSLLHFLEKRLDVVVYRLNWAPNILWARRLIREGSIFISNTGKSKNWNIVYSCLKKYAFPLKLRDPKKLYRKNFWNPQARLTKQFFFLVPQKKPYYLVQAGDIIQCAKNALINQFKVNSFLFRKPLPVHLLSDMQNIQLKWDWPSHRMKALAFQNWKTTNRHINTAIFLFHPNFRDLPKGDRVRQSFFHWSIS